MRAGVPERVEGAADVCDPDPALADVLENRPVKVPETQPFGCAIVW